MKKHFFLLLSICWLFACKKESNLPFETTISVGNFSANPTDYKIWIILQGEDGTILKTDPISITSNSSLYTYSTSDVPGDKKYDITVVSLRISTQYLSLGTTKSVPSGKKIIGQYGTFLNDDSSAWVELSISNMPEFENFQCVGFSSYFTHLLNPAPNFKAGMYGFPFGHTGTLLRWKAKNESDYRAHWLDITQSGSISPMQIALSAGDFTKDMPKRTVQLPFVDGWDVAATGIIDLAGSGKIAYLADHAWETGDPLLDKLTFEKPASLACQSYWVTAHSSYTTKASYYNWLFKEGETMKLPPVDFEVKQVNLNSNGNFTCNYTGDFDLLTMTVYGHGGQVAWYVTGAPDNLRQCTFPKFPDALKQQWPALPVFDFVRSSCQDYRDLSGYDAFLDVDRSQALWLARLGYKERWQEWHF